MLGRMDADGILEALRRYNVSHDKIAAAIGKDRTVATKMMNGVRRMKVEEMAALAALAVAEATDAGDESHLRADDDAPTFLAYVPVEVLPTFAGMGGGGTGDAERSVAMLPRSLVEDELRAKPTDLLVINVRGDSMFDPQTGRGFQHGDQLLIDRRDTNPRQPGAFALWFDDGYVVKNIEIIRKSGKLRIFSNNPAYSDDEADPDEIRIMGRPVWFARRL